MYSVFNTVYQYIKISGYWWWYLVKRVLIYGVIPAGCALMLTTEDLLQKKEHDEVKVLFKKHFLGFDQYKIQSFLFSMLFIFLWAILYFLNGLEGSIVSILTIVVIYVLVLSVVAYTYCVNYLSFKKMSFKQALVLSIYTMLKNIKVSVALLVIIGLLIAAAYMNFLFFFFFGPCLFGIGVRLVLKQVFI
jgi:uncharacterized membrane protein YesL